MISADIDRVAVIRVSLSVDEIVGQSGARRQRNHRSQQECHRRIDAARRNAVAREGLPQDRAIRTGCAREGIVERIGQRRKIAIALRLDRETADVGLTPAGAVAFPVGKPKRLVAAVVNLRNHHRSTQREAVLILAERDLPRVLPVREKVIGVEFVVAKVLVSAAMKSAASGLDHDVDIRARRPPKLSRRVVEHAKLLNGVHRWRHARRVHHHEIVVDAIHGEVVVLPPLSVHRYHLGSRKQSIGLTASHIAGARHQQDQPCVVASVYGQPGYFVASNRSADACVLGLQNTRRRLYFHPLADSTDSEFKVYLDVGGGIDNNVLLHLSLEAGHRRR